MLRNEIQTERLIPGLDPEPRLTGACRMHDVRASPREHAWMGRPQPRATETRRGPRAADGRRLWIAWTFGITVVVLSGCSRRDSVRRRPETLCRPRVGARRRRRGGQR
jgi:hypothetical protein